MGAQIQCPHCSKLYALTDEQVPQYAGQTITCTQCQKAFTVPPSVNPQSQAAPAASTINYGTHIQPTQQTNAMAIASVVLGALGFVVPVIASIPAVIFGIIGLRRTQNPAIGGKGIAITGISLGASSMIFGFVVWGCLASILLPSLNRARETANRVKCQANMKAIGQALLLYANDNKGYYPARLEDLIISVDLAPEVFTCPSSADTTTPGATPKAQAQNLSSGGHLSYVYVGQNLVSSARPDVILLYEPLGNHAQGGSNFLFADGHTEWFQAAAAQNMISQVQAGRNPPR